MLNTCYYEARALHFLRALHFQYYLKKKNYSYFYSVSKELRVLRVGMWFILNIWLKTLSVEELQFDSFPGCILTKQWLQHRLYTLCVFHTVKSVMAVPTSVSLDLKKMEVVWTEITACEVSPRHQSLRGSTCDLPRILLGAWYLSDRSVDINRNREQPVEISGDILLLEKRIAWCWVNTAIKTLSQMLGDLLLEKAGRKQIMLNWRREAGTKHFSHLSAPAHDGSYSSNLRHLMHLPPAVLQSYLCHHNALPCQLMRTILQSGGFVWISTK